MSSGQREVPVALIDAAAEKLERRFPGMWDAEDGPTAYEVLSAALSAVDRDGRRLVVVDPTDEATVSALAFVLNDAMCTYVTAFGGDDGTTEYTVVDFAAVARAAMRAIAGETP